MDDTQRIEILTEAVAQARAVFSLLTDIEPGELAEIKAIARRTAALMQAALAMAHQ